VRTDSARTGQYKDRAQPGVRTDSAWNGQCADRAPVQCMEWQFMDRQSLVDQLLVCPSVALAMIL
jgi:hypothetical protein